MIQVTNSLLIYVIAAAVASIFLIIWLIVLSLRAPQKTISRSTLIIAFIAGIASAFLASGAQQVVYTFDILRLGLVGPNFSAGNLGDILNTIIIAFFFVAITEEGVKFLILKQYLKKNDVNQVVDGMKIGFVLGLGFALVENSIYFAQFYADFNGLSLLLKNVFMRGVLSTLAHGLYGLVMGYFMVIARFHASHRLKFLWQGFLVAVLIHGLFDFLLIINLGIFSVVSLIIILAIIITWYNQRRNLELYLPITIGKEKVSIPTFLADRSEFEAFLSKNKTADRNKKGALENSDNN
ncbi:MAG: PrsW family intramembrane metalloprotease [bacterium]|nr:PrsW family intramembrane metalloprotease [bacterium]